MCRKVDYSERQETARRPTTLDGGVPFKPDSPRGSGTERSASSRTSLSLSLSRSLNSLSVISPSRCAHRDLFIKPIAFLPRVSTMTRLILKTRSLSRNYLSWRFNAPLPRPPSLFLSLSCLRVKLHRFLPFEFARLQTPSLRPIANNLYRQKRDFHRCELCEKLFRLFFSS